MKFPFPTPLPIRAPLRTPPKGQGAGHAPGHNCPPWARPPPLIIHLPEQSRRKPRASKAQSGGMPGTDHDRAWRAVQGTSVHLSLPGGSPAGPGPSPGSPRPRPRWPIRGLSRVICIRPAPGSPAREVPQRAHASELFPKRRHRQRLSPRLSPNETLGTSPPL